MSEGDSGLSAAELGRYDGRFACVHHNKGLRVISVVDRSHPVEVSYYDTTGSPYSAIASSDLAYLAVLGDGLAVFQFFEPKRVYLPLVLMQKQ